MSNENNNITTFDQILDKKYGEKGQPKREEWEQQFESFPELMENGTDIQPLY